MRVIVNVHACNDLRTPMTSVRFTARPRLQTKSTALLMNYKPQNGSLYTAWEVPTFKKPAWLTCACAKGQVCMGTNAIKRCNASGSQGVRRAMWNPYFELVFPNHLCREIKRVVWRRMENNEIVWNYLYVEAILSGRTIDSVILSTSEKYVTNACSSPSQHAPAE